MMGVLSLLVTCTILLGSIVDNAESVDTFLNVTEKVTGCQCYYDDASDDCACCTTGGCQCPHVTYPSLCTYCQYLSTCPTDFECTILNRDGCFQLANVTLPFEEAFTTCDQPDSFLAEIEVKETHHEIVNKSMSLGLPGVWTGVAVQDHLWRWVLKDRARLSEKQGCYNVTARPQESMLMNATIFSSDDLTPNTCISHCEDTDMMFAGLSIDDRPIHVICRCSNEFVPDPVYEVSLSECSTPCLSDNTRSCGGENRELIMVTGGAGNFHFNVNKTEDAINHNCAAFDLSITGWMKRDCREFQNYGHVCQYPGVEEVNCEHVLIDGRCLSIHTDFLSWYLANKHCASMGGHLAFVNTDFFENELMKLLSATQDLWWIGLTNRALVWTDQRPVRSVSSSWWNPQEPDFRSGDCVTMNSTNDYKWTMTDCDRSYSFYCQRETNECASDPCRNGGTCIDEINRFRCECRDNWMGELCDQLQPQTSPPEVSSTPPGTIAPTTQTNQPPSSERPKNTGSGATPPGGSGNAIKLGAGELAGIAIGSVALVVIIIVVVAVFCWRSRKMSQELEELKKNINENQNGSTNDGLMLTRQESVYERIDDSYDHLAQDTQNNHAYSAINEAPTHYQGLEGESNGAIPTAGTQQPYQTLNPGTTYQGLVSEPQAPTHYQGLEGESNGAVTTTGSQQPYQTLNPGTTYQGLVSEPQVTAVAQSGAEAGAQYQALGHTEAPYQGLQKRGDSQEPVASDSGNMYQALTDSDRPQLPPPRDENNIQQEVGETTQQQSTTGVQNVAGPEYLDLVGSEAALNSDVQVSKL